ncbi:hypothetical protein D3C72_1383170 [compost metagenome]
MRGDAQCLRRRPGLPAPANRGACAVQGSGGLASGQPERCPGAWRVVGVVWRPAAQRPDRKTQQRQPDRRPVRSAVPPGPGLGAQCTRGVFPDGGPERQQEPFKPGHRQQQFQPEQFVQRYSRHVLGPGGRQLGSGCVGQAAPWPGSRHRECPGKLCRSGGHAPESTVGAGAELPAIARDRWPEAPAPGHGRGLSALPEDDREPVPRRRIGQGRRGPGPDPAQEHRSGHDRPDLATRAVRERHCRADRPAAGAVQPGAKPGHSAVAASAGGPAFAVAGASPGHRIRRTFGDGCQRQHRCGQGGLLPGPDPELERWLQQQYLERLVQPAEPLLVGRTAIGHDPVRRRPALGGSRPQ